MMDIVTVILVILWPLALAANGYLYYYYYTYCKQMKNSKSIIQSVCIITPHKKFNRLTTSHILTFILASYVGFGMFLVLITFVGPIVNPLLRTYSTLSVVLYGILFVLVFCSVANAGFIAYRVVPTVLTKYVLEINQKKIILLARFSRKIVAQIDLEKLYKHKRVHSDWDVDSGLTSEFQVHVFNQAQVAIGIEFELNAKKSKAAMSVTDFKEKYKGEVYYLWTSGVVHPNLKERIGKIISKTVKRKE